MQKAESNCDLRYCVSRSFPYLRVLMQGRPEHRETVQKHPPMDRGHRAKIFAPFDALDGFSEQIRQKDRLREEAVPEKNEENVCISWEEP